MDDTRHHYIPALRFGWLTGLYDPVIHWTMRKDLFKSRLVEQVGMQPVHRVLDLGCGTATLTMLLKQRQPQSIVVGLDGDPAALAHAQEKAAQAGVDIVSNQGRALSTRVSRSIVRSRRRKPALGPADPGRQVSRAGWRSVRACEGNGAGADS